MNRLRIRRTALVMSLLLPEITDGILIWGLFTIPAVLWILSRTGGGTGFLPAALSLTLCTGYAIWRQRSAGYRSRMGRLKEDARLACLTMAMAMDGSLDLRSLATRCLTEKEGWRQAENTPIWQKDGRRCILAVMRRHPDDPISVSALLPVAVARQRIRADTCILAATAAPTNDAAAFAKKEKIVFLTPRDMVPYLPNDYPQPDEDTILRQMQALRHVQRHSFRQKATRGLRVCGRSLRFAISAMILRGLAAVTPYPLWYMAGGVFCAVMALACLPWARLRSLCQKGRKISL